MMTDDAVATLNWKASKMPSDHDTVWLWIVGMVLSPHVTVATDVVASLIGDVPPRERGC